jgi:hypothetical protein
MNMNVWDVNEPIREVIRSRQPVSPRDPGDPDVPLSQLVEADVVESVASSPELLAELSAWASEGGSC